MRRQRILTVLLAVGGLAACSGSAPPNTPLPSPSPAAEAAPVAGAPAPVDEASLRRAAASALSQQRFYAPAGDNAIEHYLALRRLQPCDRNVATALLELLPYALIASEQSVGRGDFTDARRLIALIEQVDPQAPSLGRLRDGMVAAEAAAAQRVIAEAEAAKRAAADAEAAAETAALAREQAAAESLPAMLPPAPMAAPVPTPVAAAPAPPSSAGSSPPPARSAPARPPAPRLISAPPPRYPVVAMRRKIEGSVTVQFTIQPDGSVATPSVVSADPPGVFDQAALAAARGWRFEAGAGPVSSAREVRFRLGQAAQ